MMLLFWFFECIFLLLIMMLQFWFHLILLRIEVLMFVFLLKYWFVFGSYQVCEIWTLTSDLSVESNIRFLLVLISIEFLTCTANLDVLIFNIRSIYSNIPWLSGEDDVCFPSQALDRFRSLSSLLDRNINLWYSYWI